MTTRTVGDAGPYTATSFCVSRSRLNRPLNQNFIAKKAGKRSRTLKDSFANEREYVTYRQEKDEEFK